MILIADQKRATAELLARRLKSEGYGVEVAPDALDVSRKVATGKVQLAVIDPATPGSGIDALLRIKRSTKTNHIPVIMFGSSDSESEQEVCRKAGAAAFLVKGKVTPNEVVSTIREELARTTRHYAAPVERPAGVFLVALQPHYGDVEDLARSLGFGPNLTCPSCGGPMVMKMKVDARGAPWMFGKFGCISCSRRPAAASAESVAQMGIGG